MIFPVPLILLLPTACGHDAPPSTPAGHPTVEDDRRTPTTGNAAGGGRAASVGELQKILDAHP